MDALHCIPFAFYWRSGEVVNTEMFISYISSPKELLSVLCILLNPRSLDHPTTCIIHSQLALSLEFKLSYNKEFPLEVYFSTKYFNFCCLIEGVEQMLSKPVRKEPNRTEENPPGEGSRDPPCPSPVSVACASSAFRNGIPSITVNFSPVQKMIKIIRSAND